MTKENTDNPSNQLGAIFENFVANFTSKRSNQHGDKALEEIKSLLNPIELPFLINIYPKFESEKEKHEDIFSEQGRKGGFGKTMLLTKLRNALYHLYFQKDASSWTYEDKKDAKNRLPLIELAEQYSTKEDILEKVYNNLKKLDSNIEIHFQRFKDEIVEPNKSLEKTDPSYLAEQLFDEGGESLIKYLETKSAPPQYFLFFDAFDAQYLGNEFSPLRTWLLQTLFPYLILKMKVTIIVAGREEVVFEKKYNQEDEYKITTHQFEVESFTIDQMLKYMLGYPKRVKRMKESSEIESDWETLVKSKIKDNLEISEYLLHCTNGKPIFIDYFSDLMLRMCLEKKSLSFEQLIDSIEKQTIPHEANNITDNDTKEQRAFKTYLINRLHIHESQNDEYRSQIAEAISLLSIARHGLTPTQFFELKTLGKYSNLTKQNHIDDITDFFTTIFKNDEGETNLSYVKSRETKPQESETKQIEPIRLLHDEVVDLFLKYYYEVYDTDFAIRNKYILRLKTMYEEALSAREHEKDTSSEYAKLLLEYLQYAFMYEGRKEESETINRLLFEFSYFLDRHPDLCSRLLEKGYKYYSLKKKSRDTQDVHKTLSFYNDFPLVFKLRMREAEYCLTERKNEWKERINKVFKELDEQIGNSANLAKLALTETDRCGLEARKLASQGEMKFWKEEWDEGRRDIEKALTLFYQTGDSHGLAWTEHLLGFEAIRSGELKRALKHHQRTVSSLLHHFPELQRTISDCKNNEDVYGYLYRLRFLLKTINRANGNWAINLRYDGKILEAIKFLESNLEIADIVGIREMGRNKSNIDLLYAIRGLESQWAMPQSEATAYQAKISDPILPRRLTNSYVTMQLKKIGTERRMYAYKYNTDKSINITNIEALLKEIRDNLPRKHPYLSVEPPRQALFKVSDKVTSSIIETVLFSKSREVADLYYQYGKVVLSTSHGSEKGENAYFEEAENAFENAQTIAKLSTFKYLEMECSEMLYRLAYLSQQPNEKLNTRRNDFIGHKVDIKKKKADYGVYNDLLAKFYLTEGDIELAKFSDALLPAITHIDSALENYTQALRHSHWHNQERYLLILEAFSDRIDIMFKKANEQFNGIQELSIFIKQSFSKQTIYKQDSTFGLFLDALLNASFINSSEDAFNNALYGKIKITIRKLVERGKFVKAALVNQRLIDYFKVSKNIGNNNFVRQSHNSELLLRYFQQFFCFIMSSQSHRANKIVEEIKNITINTNDPSVKKFQEALLNLIEGTLAYRTSEIWSIEKFVFGEIAHYRKKNESSLLIAENKLKLAISSFEELSTKEEESKSYKKLYSEALYRLGELYILLNQPDESSNSNFVKDVSPYIDTFISENKLSLEFKQNFNTKSCLYLFKAAQVAHSVGDKQRETDALQSVVNSLYFNGFTMKDNFEFQEKSILVLTSFNNYIRKELESEGKSKYTFPIIASKTYLVEGDLYFSCLFERKVVDDKTEVGLNYVFRTDSNSSMKLDYTKALLHKMILNYLNALNQLTDPKKKYENYHFNNLVLEINRRILLIEDKKFVKYMSDDLRPIWNTFTNLADKKDVLEALDYSLKIHELALTSKEILNS